MPDEDYSLALSKPHVTEKAYMQNIERRPSYLKASKKMAKKQMGGTGPRCPPLGSATEESTLVVEKVRAIESGCMG